MKDSSLPSPSPVYLCKTRTPRQEDVLWRRFIFPISRGCCRRSMSRRFYWHSRCTVYCCSVRPLGRHRVSGPCVAMHGQPVKPRPYPPLVSLARPDTDPCHLRRTEKSEERDASTDLCSPVSFTPWRLSLQQQNPSRRATSHHPVSACRDGREGGRGCVGRGTKRHTCSEAFPSIVSFRSI